TVELVAVSRSDGAVADLPVSPTSCRDAVASDALGADNAWPVAMADASGHTVLLTGGRRPSALSTFVLGEDGAFTQPYSTSPASANSLDVPLALDGSRVVAAPFQSNIATAFKYASGFQAAPVSRSFPFDSVPAGTVGAPIVSQHAVVFPTAKGIFA